MRATPSLISNSTSCELVIWVALFVKPQLVREHRDLDRVGVLIDGAGKGDGYVAQRVLVRLQRLELGTVARQQLRGGAELGAVVAHALEGRATYLQLLAYQHAHVQRRLVREKA